MDVPEIAADAEPAADVHARGFFAEHPYEAVLIGVAALVAVGAVFVFGHSPVSPQAQGSTWQGFGGVPSNPSQVPDSSGAPQQSAVGPQQQSGNSYVALPLAQSQDTSANPDTITAASIDQLLAILSTSSSATTVSSNSSSLMAAAYALIPNGLVATTTNVAPKRTSAQDALYQYGNYIGAVIQTYEDTHQNTPQVLKDQSTDRTNADKDAQVQQIGQALQKVGRDIAAAPDIPNSVVSYNTALGKSYQDIGAKLALIGQTRSDTDFIAAVQAYDSAADTFTKNYVALASYFSASGVNFASQDPGSVFSFTPVGL